MREPKLEPKAMHRTASRTWKVALSGSLISLNLLACASPKPALAPQAPASPPETPIPAAETPNANPETAGDSSSPPSRGAQTIEIEGEETAQQPLTLLEASRLAKERNRSSPPPRIVINNKNLADYAKRGNVTYATPKPAAPGEASTTAPKDERGEQYWRDGAARIRLAWREAIDDLKTLRQQAEELRFKFYSTDDAAYRDLQIKPEWDRTLDRVSDAQHAVEDGLAELDSFLEEGRVAGALPGWLREGIELEPTDEELAALFDDESPYLEPSEPKVTNDPPLVGEPVSSSEDEDDP